MGYIASGGVGIERLEGRTLLAGEPWGDFPQLIDLDDAAARYPNITGAGQTVAVIDSGVRYDHRALGDGFGPGHKVIAGYDFIDDDGDPLDPDGHGTGVTSVIAADEFVYDGERYRGLAPGANIVALRAAGPDRIEDALQWVLSHRTQYNIVAVNLSLGGRSYTDPVSLDPYGDELSALHAAGVFISAVAGNSGVSSPPTINYPAAHPHVYAVGAVNDDDVIASFSQRSDDLDLLAPGEDLVLPYYDKERGRLVYVREATGTSFAAPHAAGMAALLKQVDPSLTPDGIMQILQESGEDNFDGDDESGATTGLTFKRLNVADAIALALARLDDRYEENDSTSSATTMSLGDGFADFHDLRLADDDDDYFVFDLARRSDVEVDVSLSGGGSATIDLLNSSGSRIGGVGAGGSAFRLDGGRYFLRFSGDAEETISYGFEVRAGTAGPPSISAKFMTVATDGDGTAHIAYYDPKRDNLWYVTRSANGDWSEPRVVDSSAGVGQYASIAIDSKGRPGVAYYDSRNDDLKYALLHGKSWQVEKVESNGHVGKYASLAFTDRNHAAIAYYDDDGNELRFAELLKKGWSIRTIDDDGNAGRFASLAVNPETGLLAIAYVNAADDTVRFAEMVNSKKWRTTTVDESKRGFTYTSLAFDSHGRPLVSYYDANGADLKAARRSNAGRWDLTTIATEGSVGKFSRMVTGSGSSASIFYYNASDRSVYEATLSKKAWRTSQVASDGGKFLAAADVFGQKLIVFKDGRSSLMREVLG